MKKLSPRQELFAARMAAGDTLEAAAVASGYNAGRSNACRLAQKPHIRARIAEIQRSAVTAAMLTIQQKREFLARVVTAKLERLPDDSDLWQKVTFSAESTTRQMCDKLRAIQLDNELCGDGLGGHDGVTVVVRIGGDGDGDT